MQVAYLIFAIVLAAPFTLSQFQDASNGITLEDNLSWGAFSEGRIGASKNDAFPTRISGKMATYSQLALSKASKYLGKQNERTFNFQSWYQACLQDFQLKQESARYSSQEQKDDDFNAFKHKLDSIAADFARSQGTKYNKYVEKILDKSWNKVSDNMQKIVSEIRKQGDQLNDLYVKQSNLYYKLARIAGAKDDLSLVDPTDPTVFAPTSTWKFTFDMVTPVGPFGDWDEPYQAGANSNCQLKVIYEKLAQAEEDLTRNINSATNVQKQRLVQKLKADWINNVRGWIKVNREVDVTIKKIDASTANLQRLQAMLGTWSTSPFSGMNGAPGNLVPTSQLTIGVGTNNPNFI